MKVAATILVLALGTLTHYAYADPTESAVMENVYYYGDYYTSDAVKGGIDNIPTWEKCCELCQKDKNCATWSWRREGGSSPEWNHRCHLKTSGTTKQSKDGIVSGRPGACAENQGRISDDNKGCTEDNIDYLGHDIGSKTVNSESDCGILCLQNPKCNFWTWVKPSYDGRLGHGIRLICHLKSSDAGRVELADVVSGTKGCITGRKVVPGRYIQQPNACAEDLSIDNINECSAAAASLSHIAIVTVGSWDHAPYGCFLQENIKDGIPQKGWITLLNKKHGRPDNPAYQSICRIAPAPAPAPDCGCGTVTAAQDGCQCGNARCKTGERCVEGQCKTITSCQEIKRIPMAHGKVAECKNECKKTYCSGGCQSYHLHWGWSDEDKNGCVLSSCPHKG